MSILNRYILRKFVRPFLASFAALCLLLFVSQLFDRLDRFLQDGVSISHVIGFLITSLPFQALQVLPVACLLATLFVVGNLARTREYIAGLAGGLPPERFLSGLFMAGFAISIVALIANETVVPPATKYSRAVYREKIRRLGEWRQEIFADLFVSGSDGRMWAAKLFNQETGRMERVIVDTFQDGVVKHQIDAKVALRTRDGWEFQDGVRREFGPLGVAITASVPFKTETHPYTEQPSDLIVQEPQPEEMNSSTLERHIKRLQALGVPVRTLKVERYMKLAFPFSCFVVTLLGVPLALRGKGSHGMGIAAAGALTLLYLGFMQFGKALAQRILEPWIGAWLGNIVFLAIGLTLWWRMRKTA